ncbi:hypothetical protein SALBM311S_11492 [Streptomyces alboniger]
MVWTAQAEGSRASYDRQLLFYNHSYGVLDRETADAIEHSDYLRDFASFHVVRATVPEQRGPPSLWGAPGDHGHSILRVGVHTAASRAGRRRSRRPCGNHRGPFPPCRDR